MRLRHRLTLWIASALTLATLAAAVPHALVYVERSRLLRRLAEPADWRDAAERLIEIGEAGDLPPIVRTVLLRDPEGLQGWWRRIYERFGPRAAAGLPGFIPLVTTGDEEAIDRLFVFLVEKEWWVPETASVLGELLRFAPPSVRWRAALVLAEMGRGAAPALPALRRALDDRDEVVRWCAARAIRGLAPAGAAALPDLVRRLDDPRPRVAAEAALAVASVTEAEDGPASVVDRLTRLATERDGRPRTAAVKALGELRAAEERVVPVLLRLLHGDSKWPDVFWYVYPPDFAEWREFDEEECWSGSDGRIELVQTLSKLAPEDTTFRRRLVELLRSDDHELRSAVLEALRKTSGDLSDVVPDLVRLLASERPPSDPILWDPRTVTDPEVVCALGEVGPAAVPALIEALESTSVQRAVGAAIALGHIRPVTREAREALESAMTSGGPWVRVAAAYALRGIRPDVKLVPLFIEAVAGPASIDDRGIFLDAQTYEEAMSFLPELISAAEADGGRGSRAYAALMFLPAVACREPRAFRYLVDYLKEVQKDRWRPHGTGWVQTAILNSEADHLYPDVATRLREAASLRTWRPASDTLRGLFLQGSKTFPVDMVEEALESPSLLERARGARALCRVPGREDEAFALLLDLLDCPWAPLRNAVVWHALRGISDLGPRAAPAAPKLRAIADDDDGELRIAAARTLWKVTGETRLDVIAEGLVTRDDFPYLSHFQGWDECVGALRAAREMGPEARGLLPALRAFGDLRLSWRLRALTDEAIEAVSGGASDQEEPVGRVPEEEAATGSQKDAR